MVLPLYLFGIPREEQHVPPVRAADAAEPPAGRQRAGDRSAFVILALGLTVASVIMTVISVHVLTLLQARGLTLAAAVGLGALIGPSQVGARVLEAAFGRRHHPIWSLLVSTTVVAVGLAMLLGPAGIIGAGLVLYGSGSGIRSIARGTVPLALFGRDGYAVLMGRLAMPILIAQAASPSLGAVLIGQFGAGHDDRRAGRGGGGQHPAGAAAGAAGPAPPDRRVASGGFTGASPVRPTVTRCNRAKRRRLPRRKRSPRRSRA